MIDLFADPNCVHRLDKTIFLKLPLYQSKLLLKPIYVNKQLFSLLFTHEDPEQMVNDLSHGLRNITDFSECYEQDDGWSKRSDIIQKLFSVTLNKTISTGTQCGWAYVDRQAEDRFGTSLDGNLGSGRAYYTGRWFNIKGEKTPLAVSPSPYHSSGILNMEDGIWSTIIGNALFDEFEGKLSPILAILRINHKSCKIIRIDLNGSLDRITHLLYVRHPLTPKIYLKTVKAFAQLEAKKFIARILHGAWSSGNISLQGHLIDYDTICGVKGRQAQYSFTPNYIDNYFGFEQQGQLLVLNNLLHLTPFQQEPILIKRIEKIFYLEYRKQVAQGLVFLMGFEQGHLLAKQHYPLLLPLVDLFVHLSHYTYFFSQKSLYTNYASALFFHLFDFSFFFKFFPLLQIEQRFSMDQGLMMLMNSRRQHDNMTIEMYDPEYETLKQTVQNELHPYLLPCDEPCPPELIKKAQAFITQYDIIYQQISNKLNAKEHEVAVNALVINDDRLYLFPVFSLEALLLEWQTNGSPQAIQRIISRLIIANQRCPLKTKEGHFVYNVRLFVEGYSYCLINEKAIFRHVIHVDLEQLSIPAESNAKWFIKNKHRFLDATCLINDGFLEIMSSECPLSDLIQPSRDDAFLIPQCIFYMNEKKFKMTDFFFQAGEEGYEGGHYV